MDKYVSAYNKAVNSGTGMATSLVGDYNFLRIWERTRRIKTAKAPIYSLGQIVQISKDSLRFDKWIELNWTSSGSGCKKSCVDRLVQCKS
jgi:hypothetical protein